MEHISWCWIEKCIEDLVDGAAEDMCFEINCPELYSCYCCIPYWIFPSHKPIIHDVHVDICIVVDKSRWYCAENFLRCIYTNVRKHYCETVLMVLDDPTAIKMHFLWWRDVSHLHIVNLRGKLMWCWIGVNPLLLFNHSSIVNPFGCCIWCDPKSYNRSYVHFCVAWILEEFPSDPIAGITNDFDCCLHQFSVHVGKCSIARPWFSWGLLGCNALLSHLYMGAASTSSSTIVYCVLPGCKG